MPVIHTVRNLHPDWHVSQLAPSSNVSDFDYVWIVVHPTLGEAHPARKKIMTTLANCRNKPHALVTQEVLRLHRRRNRRDDGANVDPRMIALGFSISRFDHCYAIPHSASITLRYTSRTLPSHLCQCTERHHARQENSSELITIGCTSLSALMTSTEPNTLTTAQTPENSASFSATESTSGPDLLNLLNLLNMHNNLHTTSNLHNNLPNIPQDLPKTGRRSRRRRQRCATWRVRTSSRRRQR